MAAEHLELVPGHVWVGFDVAGVPELREQLEGDALTGTPDPERWMRLLHALWFVDGPVDRVVLPLEGGIVFGPHPVDDLAGLLEHTHPLPQLGESITVGAPFVLVPAGADPGVQTAVAGNVHGGGDLGVERRIPIAVAADHLTDADSLGVSY